MAKRNTQDNHKNIDERKRDEENGKEVPICERQVMMIQYKDN